MARRAKVYKTNKQKKKKTIVATAFSSQVLQIQTAEERAQAIEFNYRFRQREHEDLLDRL